MDPSMDEEFTTPNGPSPTATPRSSPSKRLSRSASSTVPRLSRKDSSDDPKYRARTEMSLTRELIDFDVIKGSAFFHTKPAHHDKKLVQEGFLRALMVPLHRSFWQHKPYFYEVATSLYALHAIALAIYVFSPRSTSTLSSFEAFFPIALLVLTAIEYGRVSSTLQAGDTDPNIKLYSPTKQSTQGSAPSSGGTTSATAPINGNGNGSSSSTSSSTPTVSPTTTGIASPQSGSAPESPRDGGAGLAPALAESENSDSTDSDDESGNSSSSSDEATPEDEKPGMFSSSAPSPIPTMFPGTPNTPRNFFQEQGDHLGRRRVTVCVWENGTPMKRAMSITELRNTILNKVKATPPRVVYRKTAKVASVTLALVPIVFRLFLKCQEIECLAVLQEPIEVLYWSLSLSRDLTMAKLGWFLRSVPVGASIISISCMLSTYYMGTIIFSALADAEVTYHRRFLYAKCFTALTSARRSRLSNLPHFRLKNVVNIKAWISLRGGRTWLKRQGRQRAADEIVSTSFLINLVLLAVMGMQAVSESNGGIQAQHLIHLEVTMWCLLSSIFMLRFMMLGSNINKKYQNTSLLLTEQMNVYLRLLVKPHKKEKLLVSNNVLKLASKLLKELNSPNKVSGLTMNPLLYNITRIIVLSAFSSAASEFFGFKLKLWKMKV
ncbi:TPA: hypothetical protein N0F65_009671 [Lagenidium giganteum]|uniref:PHTF1/2 N-terminal domain-containing protein n=1 Tax=Lagenidium giganteum TaxID=4803 RepID=A0AAV2YRW5_9STRA|nr:TPA: hypothetical protein N0F65_009671 [Lagenidium giganteum]